MQKCIYMSHNEKMYILTCESWFESLLCQYNKNMDGKNWRKIRTLYTQNANSHLYITQSI